MNKEASRIRVGQRPLQGTKLLVRMASIRSRGDSMIRVDIMAAIAPNPIAMVRDCLPCAPVFEQAVQVKGYPRQIAIVLQRRKGWKEDGHGSDADTDNPGTIRESARHRANRGMKGLKGYRQISFDPAKETCQHGRRHVSPLSLSKKNAEHGQHDRKSHSLEGTIRESARHRANREHEGPERLSSDILRSSQRNLPAWKKAR